MAKVLSSSSNFGGRGGSATPGGYNQGLQFAAAPGGDKPGTHKDLRGGSCCPSAGYNQGGQSSASKK